MLYSLKSISLVLILTVFSIASYAETKVVVIPMSGDDLKPLKNIITVAKENGDFFDPIAAIDAIGTSLPAATETNPYLIVIAPGVYQIDQTLLMKEYVSISGSGQYITKLTGSISSSGGSSSALIFGKSNASLRDVSIENIDGTNAFSIGIYNLDNSSPSISNVSVTVTGGVGTQYGIYNRTNSSPKISNVKIIVSGGSGIQHGISNHVQASPEISDTTITMSGGSIQRGISNTNGSTYSSPPKISNVKINISSGSSHKYGIYNFLSSPTISDSEINLSGASGNKYGIFIFGSNLQQTSSVKILNAAVTVQGGGNQYGVYVADSYTSARINHSTISAPTYSVYTSNGTGTNTTYNSNSILTGNLFGPQRCSFVFFDDGTELSPICSPPP